ncbi:MAG: hypothetical protein K2I56_07220 [Muribaculaceae bacterium]|nr:hypothetical protein [Muribaculaceae bacterium]
MKTIDLYTAIDRMRELSARGETFQIRFRKWNRTTRRGGDMCHVTHARLRPRASNDVVANSSYKLFLTDTDTGRPLNCWQPLVVEFNGMKTILK